MERYGFVYVHTKDVLETFSFSRGCEILYDDLVACIEGEKQFPLDVLDHPDYKVKVIYFKVLNNAEMVNQLQSRCVKNTDTYGFAYVTRHHCQNLPIEIKSYSGVFFDSMLPTIQTAVQGVSSPDLKIAYFKMLTEDEIIKEIHSTYFNKVECLGHDLHLDSINPLM